MKRSVSTALFLCVLMVISLVPVAALAAPDMPATSATGGLRYTVSVAKFENRAGWRGQWDIGDGWGIIMTDILNQTGKFIVLGETDMRKEAMASKTWRHPGALRRGPSRRAWAT